MPINDRKFRYIKYNERGDKSSPELDIEDIPEDVISKYKLLRMACD